MINSDSMYALYKGKEYECSTMFGGKFINLYSNIPQEGFEKSYENYSKRVKREECERVYRKTLCFRYKDDDFLIADEKGGKVLLVTGPRSYDLTKLGFERVDHEMFQKWVPLSEGEKYWANKEY